MVFSIPFGMAPIGYPKEKQEPLKHNVDLKKITNTKITTKVEKLSSVIEIINLEKGIEFKSGKEDLLELTFDEGEKRKSRDFRPTLPLIINY
ncbi:MAG: hypothetical protein OIF32_07865 [Campylobacterales bacterium]|nr:hypothetical protein [Campylobacterales bacterium]